MIINYNIQKINKLLHDFYNATGIKMDLLKANFSYVSERNQHDYVKYCKCIQKTSKGNKMCFQSDNCLLQKSKISKKTEMHICHAGLVDISVPIVYDDKIIGYLILGQMKKETDFSVLKEHIEKLGLDTDLMSEYYKEIPVFDIEKITSVSNIASILVKHILLENILKPKYDEKIQNAINYIDENLSSELTIQVISKKINVSKSVLYKRFHEYFDLTLSEYINLKRVEKSVEYLEKTNLSIEDISQKVGFSSISYFGKIFKRIKGTSPLKYKKENGSIKK